MFAWEEVEEFCEALCFGQQLTGSGRLDVHVIDPNKKGNINDGKYTLVITKNLKILLSVNFDQETDITHLKFTLNNQKGRLKYRARIGEKIETNPAGLTTNVIVKLSGLPVGRIKEILAWNASTLNF